MTEGGLVSRASADANVAFRMRWQRSLALFSLTI